MVFSLIGGAIGSALGLGATGTAIASGVGGLAGSMWKENRAISNANKAQKQKLSKLRISAERAGFNPLTALEATGGQGFGPTAAHTAPLASEQAILGSVQGVESILAGDAEIDRAHKKASTELMKLEAQRLEGGFGARTSERVGGTGPALGSNAAQRGAVSAGSDMLKFPMITPISGPTERGAQSVQMKMPDTVVREHIGPMRQSLTMSDGSVYSFPVLQEPEEIAAGYVAETLHENRDQINTLGNMFGFAKSMFDVSPGSFQRGMSHVLEMKERNTRMKRDVPEAKTRDFKSRAILQTGGSPAYK